MLASASAAACQYASNCGGSLPFTGSHAFWTVVLVGGALIALGCGIAAVNRRD